MLHVVRPRWNLKTLLHSCANGSSEMVGVLAFSIITILFNRILMALSGSDGVAALSYLLGGRVVDFFAKGNEHVAAVALHGFRIVATSFITLAYNTFSSGWFTALNDGRTSAILSFCRTMIFLVLPALVLPRIWGIDGVWLSLTVGEIFSLMMGIYYFRKFRSVWTPER